MGMHATGTSAAAAASRPRLEPRSLAEPRATRPQTTAPHFASSHRATSDALARITTEPARNAYANAASERLQTAPLFASWQTVLGFLSPHWQSASLWTRRPALPPQLNAQLSRAPRCAATLRPTDDGG